MEGRNKLLYRLLLAAAIAVMLFVVVGIATTMGYLTSVNAAEKQSRRQNKTTVSAGTALAEVCANCGSVESIRIINRSGPSAGPGFAVGSLTGRLASGRFGHDNGRAFMTGLGDADGSYAGVAVEQRAKRSASFEILIRLDNGRINATYGASAAPFAVGDRVRVINGTVVPES